MPFLVAVSDGFYCCLERMFDRSSKIERPVMDPTEENNTQQSRSKHKNIFPCKTALKRYHYTKSKSQKFPSQASIMVSSPPTAPPTSGSIIVPLPCRMGHQKYTSLCGEVGPLRSARRAKSISGKLATQRNRSSKRLHSQGKSRRQWQSRRSEEMRHLRRQEEGLRSHVSELLPVCERWSALLFKGPLA